MQTTNELTVQQVLELDVQQLTTADDCAEQLKLAATEANLMAASAIGYGKMAIRYAIKAGLILNRAKEILPHGEFGPWQQKQCEVIGITDRTSRKWMTLAIRNVDSDLLLNPTIKGLQDAYTATGILPEPEPKQDSGEENKARPPFVLNFKTNYKEVSEWQPSDARDFLYEFDRLASLAAELKTEFGL